MYCSAFRKNKKISNGLKRWQTLSDQIKRHEISIHFENVWKYCDRKHTMKQTKNKQYKNAFTT